MLRLHNPDEPLQFGCKLKQIEPRGYMSGGAGYVLSKEALRRFVNMGLVRNMPAYKCALTLDPHAKTIPNITKKHDEKVCKLEDDTIDGEDVEIGKCLINLDVIAGDSRDSQQRERFLPFLPEEHLSPRGNGDAWYQEALFYPHKQVGLALEMRTPQAARQIRITIKFNDRAHYAVRTMPFPSITCQRSECTNCTTSYIEWERIWQLLRINTCFFRVPSLFILQC